MRAIAYLDELDLPVAGALVDGRVITLAGLSERSELRDELAMLDMRGLLAEDEDLTETRAALAHAVRGGMRGVSPSELRLVAPLEPGKIVCIGWNYRSHVMEQGLAIPDHPLLFAKFSNTVVGDGEPVIRPAKTQALDLEVELGVVIGRRARRVPVDRALDYVAGYVTANDVSARDLQGSKQALAPGARGDGQWLRAKGSDTFLPLGPCIVTADELGDPGALRLHGWHTPTAGPDAGRELLVQDGTTGDMIFSVAELISHISASITLDPGDLVITGTPSGVGVYREPPVFLVPGDVVRVEVEGIGSVTNPIVDADGSVPPGSPAARLLAGRDDKAGAG